ncbi:inner centromere protein-like [Daphnia carinata]|uniref:inner centromere protein-like n=1 Tax=Daphnia carinata TaxID=120202 RepID=UPI002580FB38|nr:inner centromere protein-like [Daphnia carinata]
MVKEIYDFDLTLKGLIDLVEVSLNTAISKNEQNFEWLASYPAKAKQKLCAKEFKMPKTPARKKKRQQKKRFLNEDDEQLNDNHSGSDVPMKKGKLSHEDEEVIDTVGGRPKRQASCVAKSKIQQSVMMANNLRNKMRRPTIDQNESTNVSVHDSDSKSQYPDMECGSPIGHKSKAKHESNQTITLKSEIMSPPLQTTNPTSESEGKNVQNGTLKVNFAPEPEISHQDSKICEAIEIPEKQTEQQPETHSPTDLAPVVPVTAVVQNEPPKKVRPTRKVAKKLDLSSDDDKIILPPKKNEKVIEDIPSTEETKEQQRPVSNQEDVQQSETLPKKKLRKPRKPVEESSVATAVTTTTVVCSPRVTRNQRTSARPSNTVVANSPRLVKTPSKLQEHIQRNTNNQLNPTNSSPIKRIFTPKVVFSPFKASSVKTKVEAFEAALGTSGPATGGTSSSGMTGVLPEARVLLKRLTRQQLKEAASNIEKPQPESQKPKEANSKRCTFVLDTSDEKENKTKRQSVAQILARKSLDKAKHIAVAAARNKLMNSVVQNETTESPNVHVNKNAATLMSKFRFAGAPGSSGSSSSSLNRNVTMTQAKNLTNVVTGVGTFTGTKPVGPMPTKATEEDELKRKELELKRLKEREEEASRKREELMRAKAEEQKRKQEARAKRAMEQRALRAKQLEEEQKQKLENKEERSAQLKQKLLVENQEKAERFRLALLRHQEAEQRRKAEELQKQQEEAQLRLQAAKKEQEELERQAKLKTAEAEKTKAVAPVAEPSTLNTTVTLTTSNTNNYQLTPVRITKTGKVFNPDNYDIADMRSDDSTDDDSRPKKVIPGWARSINLKIALEQQAKFLKGEDIFPAKLLKEPNLNAMFKIKRARFNKRTSSAVWKTPPANYM